jgi:hypothetical protein
LQCSNPSSPKDLVLGFVNHDFVGVQNTGYFDNTAVTSVSNSELGVEWD